MKYTLVRGENGKTASCAFFNSDKGCRNGDGCKFAHTRPGEKPVVVGVSAAPAATSAVSSESSSDDSSDDEEEGGDAVMADVAPPARIVAAGGGEKKRKNPGAYCTGGGGRPIGEGEGKGKEEEEEDEVKPCTVSQWVASEVQGRKKRGDAAAATTTTTTTVTTPTSSSAKSCTFFNSPRGCKNGDNCRFAHTNADETGSGDQRSSKRRRRTQEESSPVDQKKQVKRPHSPAPAPAAPVAPPATATTSSLAAALGPSSNGAEYDTHDPEAVATAWAGLLSQTREYSQYAQKYTFDETSQWVTPRACSAECAGSRAHVLAIDCEMCVTEDPVSEELDNKALVRLSGVSPAAPSSSEVEVEVLDSIVSPGLPVVDFKTDIHGITKEQMDAAASYTLRHAQAAMLKLCCDRTVLVGHSLNNDLLSLKMNHQNVVDTAMLVPVVGHGNKMPSLRELSRIATGVEMPDIHDSVNDARTTLRVAEFLRTTDAPVEVRRANSPVRQQGGGDGGNTKAQLLVHRVPKGATEAFVSDLLVKQTGVVSSQTTDVSFGHDGKAQYGRCTVAYKTPQHAQLAFAALPGKARPDTAGHDQKRVYQKSNSGEGNDYVQVRTCWVNESMAR